MLIGSTTGGISIAGSGSSTLGLGAGFFTTDFTIGFTTGLITGLTAFFNLFTFTGAFFGTFFGIFFFFGNTFFFCDSIFALVAAIFYSCSFCSSCFWISLPISATESIGRAATAESISYFSESFGSGSGTRKESSRDVFLAYSSFSAGGSGMTWSFLASCPRDWNPPCLATSAQRAFCSKIDYSYEFNFLLAFPSRPATSPDPLPIVVCKILSIKFYLSDSCTCIALLLLDVGDNMVDEVSESD